MASPLAVEAHRLVKIYSDGVKALNGLEAEIPLGSTFCLAGPNGAGKTTFIRIASTVLRPTSGEVLVMGYDVVRDAWRVRRLIAVMPQEGRAFNDALSVFEAVYYYLLARGEGFSSARREARRVLEDLDLWQYHSRLVLSLSGGLKRRVLLAMVLATGAEVVFLDEPTTGLDPEARRTTWGYIKRLAREGQTIVFSTHQLSEAEAIADSVLLINRGVSVGSGPPRSLVEKLPYRYKVIVPTPYLPDHIAEKAAKIRHYGGLVYVYTDSINKAMEIASELVLEAGGAQVERVDLEDFFVEASEAPSFLRAS